MYNAGDGNLLYVLLTMYGGIMFMVDLFAYLFLIN